MMSRSFKLFAMGLVLAGLLQPAMALFPEKQEPGGTTLFTGVRPREIELSPCGRYLAVAGYEDATGKAAALLLVWHLTTKKEVFRHRDPEGGFITVSFSPDGNRLAAAGAGSNRTAKVWEFPSGKEIAQLANDENVDCLRFSPDGTLLAMATADFTEGDGYHPVILWDTAKFQKKSILKGTLKTIWSLAFSPDGKLLASGDASGSVRLWNVKDAELLMARGGDDDWARSVCFSRTGKILASVHRWGRIRLFDVADPKQPPTVLRGQDGGISAVIFGPDDRWLFTGGREFPPFKDFGPHGTVQVWNVAEKKLHAKLNGEFAPLAVSRDGQTLITTIDKATVKVRNLPKDFYAPAK